MKRSRNRSHLFSNKVILLAALAGMLLVGGVFFFYTQKERQEGTRLIQETLEIMRLQCLRYENLTVQQKAQNQVQLLEKAKELRRCLAQGETGEEFLKEYLEEQRLTGIVLMGSGEPDLRVSLDEGQEQNWTAILQDKNVLDVASQPKKNYVSRIQMEDGSLYDYAAIARKDQPGLILCYTQVEQSSDDENQIGIENILAAFHLQMDGIMLIADDTWILSSNENNLRGEAVEAYPLTQGYTERAEADTLGTAEMDGWKYMSCYSRWKGYTLYVFFPARAFFKTRSFAVAYAVILYILLLLGLVIIRQREAHHSNQMRMEFLRRMSHDIRTPVNGIRGMIRIGNRYPDDPETQRECREKIWEASGFLTDLVNDVLDMGRLEFQEVRLEKESFNLRSLVNNVYSVMEGQGTDRSVTLAIDRLEGTHWNLIGSPVHVRRILTNLISNAIKYNREGGKVLISCLEKEEAGSPDTAVFEFLCEDTGIGMSRDFQKRMFEQFTQEEAAGEQSHHGTGLGLAIVKSLVTEMKGTIRCQSERGQGTRFSVLLPFTVAPQEQGQVQKQEEQPPASTESLKGVTVLLVEDNELNMEIAEFILEEEGAFVQKAWNGREAVQIFERSEPGEIQVILMDIMMPVMDGEEAARVIRRLTRPDSRTVPIIAMTANAFEEDVQTARNAGMNAHVPKPIDVELLKKVIYENLYPETHNG
jgi:signal transduction histidine kinase